MAKTKDKKKNKKKTNRIVQRNSTSVGVENSFIQRMPLKPHFNCIMKYAETFTMTTGAAGVLGSQQTMNLNCLYDPNYTGVGHQPYFYDQLTPLYKSYKVHAVKATLIWSTIGGTADVMTAYTMYPDLGGLSLTGLTCDAATEQPNVSTGLLSPSGNTRTVEQNIYIPLPKVFGVSKKEFEDQDFSSELVNSAAQPVRQAYLSFSVGSPSGTAGESCTVQCTLYYYCSWSARQTQSQS